MKEIITERPNLFEPNDYINMCVELDGKICPQKLTAAVSEAYKANEATMSKIVLNCGVAYYEKMPVTGCKITVTGKNWIELIKENEKITFALDKGELVRTFIIPSDACTKILIMAHHLVGDGKSIIYFINDIMTALSQNTLKYKPLVLLTKNHFPVTKLSIPAKLFIRRCKYKWKNDYFTWQDYYNIHDKYWEAVSSDIRYKILSVDETAQIIKNARQIGCSVNSYLITVLLQKYKKKCEIGIPVSIRKTDNKAMANLTSGISIRCRYNDKKTFAKNAMQVHNKIKKQLRRNKEFVLKFIAELPPTLIDAVLLNTHNCYSDRLAKRTAEIMGYVGKTRDLGVTNLTVLDIPTIFGSYRIENIIFVPPSVSYSHNVIGISTVNGKMTFSFHSIVKR